MGTRRISRATIAAALLVLCPLLALGQQKTEDPSKSQTTQVSAQQSSAQSGETKSAPKAANALAVCRCGMAFAPAASTKTFTHEGSLYMVCSEACHKAATGNPAQAAKEIQGHVRKIVAQAPTSSSSGAPSTKPN